MSYSRLEGRAPMILGTLRFDHSLGLRRQLPHHRPYEARIFESEPV